MLDLKYRPRRFSDVLGNPGVKRVLLSRSRDGTLGSQSMMFGGPKGCGKTSLARIVAMALSCTNLEDGEPCGSCPDCHAIVNETSGSVEEMDAASQGTVDKIREMVTGTNYHSMGRVSDVYILDEAQRISAAAQDALLKSIEDRSMIVILCTTEAHKIKAPIRSRVEEYPVRPPPREDLMAWMSSMCNSEKIAYESEALSIIATMTGLTPRSCAMAIDSVSSTGSVSVDAVREMYRFDSLTAVDRILSLLDTDPVAAFAEFDALTASESPTWVRDSIVSAITSGARESVGASPTYPVPTTFFSVRGMGWIDLAQELGTIEKPLASGIGAALLRGVKVRSSKKTVDSQSTRKVAPPPTPEPEGPPTPEPEGPVETPPDEETESSLQVDGVTFSSKESLTTLDSRVGFRSADDVKERPSDPPIDTQFREDLVPMPEREFARCLIERLK